jgi:O-antigen ligase
VRAATDTRSRALAFGLFGLALLTGILSGVDPRLGLAAAMGVAFVTVVLADLSVGLCIYALLAFLNIVPDAGGSFLSFDKVAGGLLALSWLAAVGNRRQARRAFFTAHPQFSAVMLFFLAWVLLSLTWAEVPGEGFEPASRYLLNAFLFLIVFTAVRNRKHVIWLVAAFVAASTLSAVYGLVVSAPTGDQGRLGGSLGEPNELAAVLVAGIVLAAGLAMVVRGPLTRLALIFAACTCLLSTFLTLSRGGLIALAVAMVALVFVAGRWRVAAAAMAVLALSALVGFFAFVATPDQRARVTEVGTGSGRSDIWTVGWRMVRANPGIGVGVGQFQISSVHYLIAPGAIQRSDLIIDTPKVAHNIYLQVLAELGIVGFVPFMLILGFGLTCCLRAARAFERRRDLGMELISRAVFVALVGILAADFFVSQQFSKQLWLLLGLGPALLAIAARSPSQEGEHRADEPVAPLSPARLEPVPAHA